MKALVGAFNQEKALVGAFSVIGKTDCETDGALNSTSAEPQYLGGAPGRPVLGAGVGAAGVGLVVVGEGEDAGIVEGGQAD